MRHSGLVLIAVVGTLFDATGCTAPGGGPVPRYSGNPHDMDIVIYVDAQCNVLKSNPSVGFSEKKVTWHLRSACTSYTDSFSVAFTGSNGSPASENCPDQCQKTIANGVADVTINIKPKSGGTYQYTLKVGKTTLDPDLMIDP